MAACWVYQAPFAMTGFAETATLHIPCWSRWRTVNASGCWHRAVLRGLKKLSQLFAKLKQVLQISLGRLSAFSKRVQQVIPNGKNR